MSIQVDLITKGGAEGVGAQLQSKGKQLGHFRPFLAVNEEGKEGIYLTLHMGGDKKDPKNWKTVEAPANYAATLRYDEWKHFDDVLQMVNRERLTGIGDLVSMGLTYNLTNPMGTSVLQYEELTDGMEATISMDGVARGKNDRPEYTTKYLPIPIISGDFEVSERELSASRDMGNPLDTTKIEQLTRRINEKLDKMLFTNTTYSKGGGVIYSYINHPDRNQQTLTLAWDDATKTPSQILADVKAMKQKLVDDHFYGPYMLYIPSAWEIVLDGDYYNDKDGTVQNATSDTIRDRILKLANIKDIKVADNLPANNAVMVNMTSDVVRLVNGFAPQTVQWQTEGGMVTNFKVMTIQVPQIRSTNGGEQCGVCHLSA